MDRVRDFFYIKIDSGPYLTNLYECLYVDVSSECLTKRVRISLKDTQVLIRIRRSRLEVGTRHVWPFAR